MNYTVYDTTMDSPSFMERDIIWSVLLFGDKIQITSGASLLMYIHGVFPFMKDEDKRVIQIILSPKLDPNLDINQLVENDRFISRLRNKKLKTGEDQKKLQFINAQMKKVETAFKQVINDKLTYLGYKEIVPLAMQTEEDKIPDITIKIGMHGVEKFFGDDTEENLIEIISNALLQPANIIVMDERIQPYIVNCPLPEYDEKKLAQDEKPVIFSEKILQVPLCYVLKENDVRLARNELTNQFQEFHRCIDNMSESAVALKTGMAQFRSLLPDLQEKVNNNAYISNARNQQENQPVVDLHLAFTSNRGMLNILHLRGMLNEEQVLQAAEIVQKEANLDVVRPFMYITH